MHKLDGSNARNVPDIFQITKDSGFSVVVFQSDDDEKSTDVKSNLQGYVVVKDRKKTIGVNVDLSFKAKRFMIMYMFSSYMLNGNNEDYADAVYTETIYDRDIYDYALSLLIPNKCFETLLKISDNNMDMLGKIYNVSDIVLEEKIKRLKKD